MSIRKTQTGRKSLLAGASVLAATTAMFTAGGVTVAAAQEADEDEAIVVTGTRIARRDAVAESPILTVGQEEMSNSGYVTVEQYLNTLPQMTAGVSSQSNNPSSNGRAFIDLRGLGSGRNLVLIDGRRAIGQAAGGTVVDTNTIPAALIERVEIITGGAASTYGADAVAGVVNFILRDNFEGFAIDGQYRITEAGDGEEWGTDVTFGGNFADGRGNAVFNASYFSRDAMYKNARDFAAQASSTTGTFPGGAWTSSGTASPDQADVDALFGAGLCAANGGSGGFGFNPDGSVFCTGVGSGNPLNVVGYTGPQSHIATAFYPDFFSYNFEPDNILVLPQERWNLFSRISLDINDSFRPYVQTMFTNYNAKTELAPTPGGGFTIPFQNPFVQANADLVDLLNSRNGGVGVCTTPVVPAGNANTPTGTGNCAPFAFSKRFNQVGGRTSYNTHDVWQIVLGTEGDLTDSWSYDIYTSFGRSVLTEVQGGNIRVPQFQAVLNDPLEAGGSNGVVGDGPCATWNPMGLNSALPAACAAFISLEAKNLTTVEQRIVEGTVTGDLFELPAGAVQIALGAGYREVEFDFRSDAGLAPGLVVGFNGQLPVSGTLDWFDIFGEIYVPILANLPGVESLSLTAGYRTTDNSASGMAESWKVTGDWTVTDWLRFRAGIQTAIRAPNIAELFAPMVPGFPNIGTANDPCNTAGTIANDPLMGRNGPNGALVQALCAAQSSAAGANPFVQTFGQAQAIGGGNPNLKPETADSWSAGFVLNSPFSTGGFLDSLYLSVDYWSIEMENVIAGVGALTILQRCFNRDNANPTYSNTNQWCQLFTRADSDGRVINLQVNAQNQAFRNTSGVDIVFGFGFDLGSAGSLDFNTVTTWVERFETSTSVADPTYDLVGSIGSGTGSATPEWRTTINATWAVDALTIGATARWIDEMIHSNAITGAGPGTGVPDKWYFDLRGSFDLTSNLTLRAGVNNVADTQPPIYTPNVQANTDPSTYDVLGRRFFVGFNLRM